MARALDPDIRRGEILDRAFALFAQVGFRDLSMRDLARELNASTGTLYHWFAGKDALWAAVVERQALRLVLEATASLPDGPADLRLRALANWVDLRAIDLQAVLRVAMEYQNQSADGRAILARAVAGLRLAVAEHIPQPPQEAARTLALIFGVLATRSMDPTAPRLGELV